MTKRAILGAALMALLAVPSAAVAQDEEGGSYTPGQMWHVVTWTLNPGDVATFRQVAEQVVEAAMQANLAAEYGWGFWNNMYSYTLVSQFEPASFTDPEMWMRQFKGTPGESTLQQAFEKMASVQVRSIMEEVLQDVNGWSFEPEGSEEPAEHGFGHVHEFWLKGGVEQEFDGLIKDFMAFFKEMGYAYPVHGHRVRMGDTGRALFVTMYDTPEAYFGANSIERLVQQHNTTERWGELLERLAQLVTAGEESFMMYQPSMSYWGPAPDVQASR